MTGELTEAEFEVVLRRAGLTLDHAQRGVLLDVLPQFDAMLARVRNARDRSAEPAHIFVPPIVVPGVVEDQR